jgi:hypothetical protein
MRNHVHSLISLIISAKGWCAYLDATYNIYCKSFLLVESKITKYYDNILKFYWSDFRCAPLTDFHNASISQTQWENPLSLSEFSEHSSDQDNDDDENDNVSDDEH